jgi:plasmid stability protein
MKNITVTVDDELYRRARVRAAEQRTSVSAQVREFLQHWAAEDTEFARLQREQNELIVSIRARHAYFSGSSRLPRERTHERDSLR